MADRDEKDLEKVAQRVEAEHGYLHIDERAAEYGYVLCFINCLEWLIKR